MWVSAGAPLPPAGAQIRAERHDIILWEMSLKTDQAMDETSYCFGGERDRQQRDRGSLANHPLPSPALWPQ